MKAPLKLAHFAQLKAIDWLIGRCESQFVRAWLVQERELLKGIGYPIRHNGAQLDLKEVDDDEN